MGYLPALSSVPESFTTEQVACTVGAGHSVLTFQSCLNNAVRGLRDSGEKLLLRRSEVGIRRLSRAGSSGM